MSSEGSKRRKLSPINANQCSGGEVDGGTLADNVGDAILDFFTSAGNDDSDVLRDVISELALESKSATKQVLVLAPDGQDAKYHPGSQCISRE